MIRRGPGGVLAAAALSVLLSGCGMFSEGGWFGGDEEPPLPGERVSVLELERAVEPDPTLAATPVVLPAAMANRDWPVPGSVPSHVPGHPSLGWPLRPAWSTSVGDGEGSIRRLLTPPVIAEGRAFAMDASGAVAAIDIANGRRLWRVRVATPDEDSVPLGGGVAYYRGLVYATTGFGEVLALDPANGGMVWRATVPSPIRAAPTVQDGRVFVVTVDNNLVALDAANGQTLWIHSGIVEDAGLLGAAAPAVEGGVVIAPYSSGEVFALRAETGRPIWSDSLAAIRRVGALAGLADIRGLPVIDRGLVFATSHSGRTVAIDLRTGARVWDQEIGGIFMPWVVGEHVFMLTNDSQMVAMNRTGGQVRWVRPLQRWRNTEARTGPIHWAGPVLGGGRLIVVGSHGEAVTLDPATGEINDSFDLRGGGTKLVPVVAGDTLYVLSDNGTLTAYR